MSKKGSTSINIKKVATAGTGGSGKSQQHDLRAIGLGRDQVGVTKENGKTVQQSCHLLEDLMMKHFSSRDMAALSPDDRRSANAEFMKDVNALMESRGLIGKSSDDDDKMVMSHVDPEKTPLNDFLILHPLENYLDTTLRPLVKEKTNKQMQNSCTPYKEGVVVINENTTIEDLLAFGNRIEHEKGWHPMQIYIHHDEGHTDKQTMEWKENRHAHIIFDTINHETGKTIQLNRLDLAEFQTILADTIHMERGENSSDLAHLNSMELKAQMELSNQRLEKSLAVIGVGKDPRQMMADSITNVIDNKLTGKPNDRTTLTLLREVGKDLNTNPTKLCAEAVFAELKRQPEKLADVASNFKLDIKNLSTEDAFEKVHQALLNNAVRVGKTESAKEFRPTLNSAKDLGLDLTPVMLNPIRESLRTIPTLPINRDNNNMLWCANLRCKVNPTEMLDKALVQGLDELDSKAKQAIEDKNKAEEDRDIAVEETKTAVSEMNEAIKVKDIAVKSRDEAEQKKDEILAEIDSTLSSTLEVVYLSKNDELQKAITDALDVELKHKADKTSVDVINIAHLGRDIDMRPSEAISVKFGERIEGYNEKIMESVCKRFGLADGTPKDKVCQAVSDHAKQCDDKRDYSTANKVISLYKSPFSFEIIAEAIKKHIIGIAGKSDPDSKIEKKLERAANFFKVDVLDVMKAAVAKGKETLKERVNNEIGFQLEEMNDNKITLETQKNTISTNQETIEEQEKAIKKNNNEKASTQASVDTLKAEQEKIKNELGERSEHSSFVNTIKNIANKGKDALEDFLDGRKSSDLKEMIAKLINDGNEKDRRIELLESGQTEENKEARQSGYVKARSEISQTETDKAVLKSDNASLKSSLKSSEATLKQKKEENNDLNNENANLRDLVSAMLPSQPKAILKLISAGMDFKNLAEAISNKVVKGYSGVLTHPEYKNDPVNVVNKDIVIEKDNPEPMIGNKPLVEWAIEEFNKNRESHKQDQRINKGPKL